MRDLYSVVNDIVNAKTKDEAASIFYGKEGIEINSEAYYKNVLSTFVRKKEMILKQIGDNIIFDIDKDIKDVWDIVFIGQYIQQEWKNEVKKLDKLISETNDSVEKQKLRTKRNLFNSTYMSKVDAKLKDVIINGISSNSSIENRIKELKRSIVIFKKIRDSLGHKNDNFKLIDDKVSINNNASYFEVNISLKYLDQFNNGRIIAEAGEENLINKVNSITFPLLYQLNFDPKRIDSFFYNVEPSQLEYILDKCNNDVSVLYQLPAWVFYTRNNIYLNYFLNGHNVINRENIQLINRIKYVPYPNDRKDYKRIIELFEYLKSDREQFTNGDYEIINLIGHSQIVDANDVKNKIEFIRKYEININEFSDRYSFFSNGKNIDSIVKLLNEYSNSDNVKEFICKLPNATFYDYIELKKVYSEYSKENNNVYFRMQHGNNVDNNIKIFNHLIERDVFDERVYSQMTIFKYDSENLNSILSYIDDVKSKYGDFIYLDAVILSYWFDYYKNIDFEKLVRINDFFRDMQNKNINIINHSIQAIVKSIYNGLDPSKLDDEILDKIIYAQNNGITVNLVLDYNLKSDLAVYNYLNGSLDFTDTINILLESENSSKKEFILGERLEDIKYFKVHVEDKKLNNILEKLSSCINNSIIDNKELDYEHKKYFLETLNERLDIVKKLYCQIISKKEKTNDQNLEIFNNYISYFKSIIESIDFSLSKEKIDEIINSIKEFDNSIIGDITKVKFSFSNTSKAFVYDLISEESTRNKRKYKKENIDFLLERFNNDYSKLETLPVEFFTCPVEVIDGMLQKYSKNKCMSIFGIDNPKIIASLLYFNDTFTKYKKNDYNDIDIDYEKIIHTSFNDTYNFKSNITTIDIDQESFLTQFLVDRNGNTMVNDANSIKSNLLDKLRNSAAHFRFKPVKDNNGNTLEDKLYLYDEDKNGVNNFNIIVNIKDLVEITKKVEDGLKKKNGIVFEEEENKFAKR